MLTNETPAGQRLRQMREALDKTLRISPMDINLFCKLGRAFWEAGQEEDFKKCLRQTVKILQMAMRHSTPDAVLRIEMLIFNTLVTTVESEDHYYRCFSQWRDDMAAYGRKFRMHEAAGQVNVANIGFVVHTGVLLGHTEVMFNYLESLKASGTQGVCPKVYVLGEAHPPFLARAAEVGVEVWAPDASIKELDKRIFAVRDRMKADGYGIAVWVCVPVTMVFAFSARLAPVQIWWSLKFHPLSGSFIDGYITYGAWGDTQRTFGKQAWDVCPMPLALEYELPSAQAVAEFRKPFGDAIILGTLAREEKINRPGFLEAVSGILQDNPRAVFLWTGRNQPSGVLEHFRAQGVANRCHYIGWVDTALVSACFDVFLETFPFGCGITAFQAIKAGVPLVSYAEKTTMFNIQRWSDFEGLPREQWDVSTLPVLTAKTVAEYRALTNRLIQDAAFRAEVVRKEQAFYQEQLAAMGQFAERFFATVQAQARKSLAADAA